MVPPVGGLEQITSGTLRQHDKTTGRESGWNSNPHSMCIHFAARLFICRLALKNTSRSKEKICPMYFEICRTYFFFAPNPAENRLPCGFRKATHNAAFFVRIRNVPAPPVRSVHVSCKIRLRSESFKPLWFLLQNMLTLQQPASRQRCRAASGYGYIYKRRLLDALFLTLRNFANFQVWSRTRQQ